MDDAQHRSHAEPRASTERNVDPNLGRVLAGQFRIDARIGEGGMGNVYRGVQLSIGRPVAIKVIAGAVANHPECIKRFRREAEAMALLTHPHSVRLFDFGAEQGELYMVMELLEGEDLSNHLQRKGALPPREALGILRQVLQALSEAHALGIVHRDLKPANVFLSRAQDGQVFAKVMDFGIAGIQRETGQTKLTLAGSVLGTPAYMSPEQAQGNPVDARSDLYSLGIMLFEMLTGNTPFVADSVVHLLLAQVSQTPPRLRELRADLPGLEGLEALLDGLLAKAPEARPASAAQVLSSVEQQLRQLDRLDSLVLAHTVAAPAAPRSEPPAATAARTPLLSVSPARWRPKLGHVAAGLGMVALLGVIALVWPEEAPTPAAAAAAPAFPAPAAAPVPEAAGHDDSTLAPRPAAAERAKAPADPAEAPANDSGELAPEAVDGQAVDATGRPFPRLRRALDKIFGPTDEAPAAAPAPARPTSYPDVSSAKRAYRTGQIGERAYEDNIRALKARRARRIDAEKRNLRAGSISRVEYKRRVHQIDAEYEGR